jgi:flagellar FliL protein
MATITDAAGGSRLQQRAGGPDAPGPQGGKDTKDTKDKDKKERKGGKGKGGDETGDDAKGGRGKIVILAGLIAVLVLGGAAGAYLTFFSGPSTPAPPTGGDIVQMDPTTLSLADHHYLKVQVAIQLVDGKATAETFDTVKAQALVVDTFSDRDPDAVASNKARKRLGHRLLTALKKAYPKEVFDLYITQYVIQ